MTTPGVVGVAAASPRNAPLAELAVITVNVLSRGANTAPPVMTPTTHSAKAVALRAHCVIAVPRQPQWGAVEFVSEDLS